MKTPNTVYHNATVTRDRRNQLKNLKSIYSVSDFIWAAYPTDNTNAIYAVSNKYYECNLFNIIPIISNKTMMASHLKDINANFIQVNEYSLQDIQDKLTNFSFNNFLFTEYEKKLFWEYEIENLINEIKLL
jgi:hypothetical protein